MRRVFWCRAVALKGRLFFEPSRSGQIGTGVAFHGAKAGRPGLQSLRAVGQRQKRAIALPMRCLCLEIS